MAQTKKPKSFAFLRWLLLLPIPLLWCALNHYGTLSFLENKSVDWRFRYRGEIDAPVRVVYVDIDSLSIDVIGNQPWNRSYYGQVAATLINVAKVKGVGFDIVFSEAGMAESVDRRKLALGNREFGTFLSKQPPVALAASYGGWQFTEIDKNRTRKFRMVPILANEKRRVDEMEPPETPEFEIGDNPDNPKRYSPPVAKGLIDTLESGTRIVPAWTPSNLKITYYHMALHLARFFWGLPPESLKVEKDRIVYTRPDGSVFKTVPLQQGQLLEINWFTPWKSPKVPHFEFVHVYEYSEMLKSEDPKEREAAKEFFNNPVLKDSIVLIGPVDPLLQDLATTSLDSTAVPKVSVHGNLLKTIVSGKFLQRLPTWRGMEVFDWAIILGLTIVITAFGVTPAKRSWVAALLKGMAVVMVVVYVVIAFELFKTSHLVLPFTAPLGAAFMTSFAGLIWQVVDEQKAKGRIKGMFGTYISPQLVEQMVESGEDPKLGGHVEDITAYFSDIQSFSSFSEVLTPEKLVELMNEYLTACTDIVQGQGGTLDKYIGDAVVAMFGAPIPLPDHAYRACVATQLVHLKLNELRVKWTAEGDKWPEIVKKMQSRIGVNGGQATVGNMGSATRFNYTMMGDNVNLAARMESGAKSWGVYTMCTEVTKVACEKHGDRVVFRPLAKLVVKGRSQPVPVYEIVGLKENVTPQTHECIAIFRQALDKYYARDWPGALELFAKSRELEFNVPGKTPGVVSNPSIVYIEKVVPEAMEDSEEYGPNWDGRYIMKEK
jgi:adenylate cyclase